MQDHLKEIDQKEIDLPETTFINDIETKVFQGLAVKCLDQIEGVCLPEFTLFDSLLGRDVERIKGITVEQDQKRHSINIKIEINVQYGISLQEKAAEIQSKLVEQMTQFTGLHVGCVHVIFKNVVLPGEEKEKQEQPSLEEQEEVEV